MSNKILNRARYQSTSDNWYTSYETLEKELPQYNFEGKRVLCNADDPIESAFTCYFIHNFHQLKLKQLTCIGYAQSPLRGLYKTGSKQLTDPNVGYVIHMTESYSTILPLTGDGGFNSPEVLPYWENADIVCTNPPFSKFREFFGYVLKYGLSYLLISNLNAISYTIVFPQIKAGLAHLGRTYGMKFRVPLDDFSASIKQKDSEGQCWKKLGTAVWLTNLTSSTPRQNLELNQCYSPKLYPRYDGQDVIHIDRISNIPKDYYGVMGVPITYLVYHNPQQFEILGQANNGSNSNDLFVPRINGKKIFKRLLIRRLQK